MFCPHNLTLLVIITCNYNIKNIKLTNTVLKKNHNKKNHVRKFCSDLRYFVRKATLFFPIKSIKRILKKIITKKNIWGNTIVIHSVLKKNITELNFQTAKY